MRAGKQVYFHVLEHLEHFSTFLWYMFRGWGKWPSDGPPPLLGQIPKFDHNLFLTDSLILLLTSENFLKVTFEEKRLWTNVRMDELSNNITLWAAENCNNKHTYFVILKMVTMNILSSALLDYTDNLPVTFWTTTFAGLHGAPHYLKCLLSLSKSKKAVIYRWHHHSVEKTLPQQME